MAKNKGTRIVITLECTECRTNENRKNTPDRIEIKKFCRYCNQHTFHKEIK